VLAGTAALTVTVHVAVVVSRAYVSGACNTVNRTNIITHWQQYNALLL
jgi:hypothetical protein